MADPQAAAPPSPTSGNWREQRHTEREERREFRRQHYGWVGPGIGGIVLVLLGLVFLAQNFGYVMPDNWWAVFLLIPAVGAFIAASEVYRAHGQLGGEGTAALLGGIVFAGMAVMFFFDIGWGLFWPLILIAIGAGILIRTYWRR